MLRILRHSGSMGNFPHHILQANEIVLKITATAVSSVVPSCDYRLSIRFHSIWHPVFCVKSWGWKQSYIKYKNPNEVGAIGIANAIGAINAYPHTNIMLLIWAATTLCRHHKKTRLSGGKYYRVCVFVWSHYGLARRINGSWYRTPTGFIGERQGRVYKRVILWQLGALKEIMNGIKQTLFAGEDVLTIAREDLRSYLRRNHCLISYSLIWFARFMQSLWIIMWLSTRGIVNLQDSNVLNLFANTKGLELLLR